MAAQPTITAYALRTQSLVVKQNLEENMEKFELLLISPPIPWGGRMIATYRPSKITKMSSIMSRVLNRLYSYYFFWQLNMDEMLGWYLIATTVDEVKKTAFLKFFTDIQRATIRIPELIGYIHKLYFSGEAYYKKYSETMKNGLPIPEALDLELHEVVNYALYRSKQLAQETGLYAQRELDRERHSKMTIYGLKYLVRRCGRMCERLDNQFVEMGTCLADRLYEVEDCLHAPEDGAGS